MSLAGWPPKLEKDLYEETHRPVPCFTRHAEFFEAPRRVGTEAATWQLGLRSQTPAFVARWLPNEDAQAGCTPRSTLPGSTLPGQTSKWSPKPWNKYHHQPEHSCYSGREHSFDMLRDLHGKRKESRGQLAESLQASPRAPRVRVDTHRESLFLDETYKGKVAPNANTFRPHLQDGAHPDVCRWILSIGR